MNNCELKRKVYWEENIIIATVIIKEPLEMEQKVYKRFKVIKLTQTASSFGESD